MAGLQKGHRDQTGITGLETAIILIAFVTVAAVFGYGIFSAEKGKETVYLGLEEAKSTMQLAGTIIAKARATDNTTVAATQPYWLVDSEADWYEGYMEYCFCNDSDILRFTGEKVLFEDGFTWTNESDAPWTVHRLDREEKDNEFSITLDCNPAPSMIMIEGAGVRSGGGSCDRYDKLFLEHWGPESGGSPIDVAKHAYEVIWKARLNVDEGWDTWEITIRASDTGGAKSTRESIFYDYGGCAFDCFRDQIKYGQYKGEKREVVKFEHWGKMNNRRWNTGKIYFDHTHFVAYNDRYGDDDSSDGNLGGFYKEAEATAHYKDWSCLDSRNPTIRIVAIDRGHGEQFWLDYLKVTEVDETVSEGTYMSKTWRSGATRHWSQWRVSVDGSGSYDIDFGTGNGIFYDTLLDVPASTTLQFKIIMYGNTAIDSIKVSK